MDGDVGVAGEHRPFDLSDERPAASERVDGGIRTPVAPGLDDDEHRRRTAVDGPQTDLHPPRLFEGERAAPCGEPQRLHSEPRGSAPRPAPGRSTAAKAEAAQRLGEALAAGEPAALSA